MASKTDIHRPTGLFDLLHLPLIGRLLKWRYGRLLLQIPYLLLALLLIYDGFTGPQRAAQNLATVVPWVHYRGFVVLALLLAGNLFCMGCPFTIPRTLAKHLSIRGRRFPRVLRNKWLAILSLFGLFFVYEWFDLWASPALTAWLIVAYFLASFVLEAVFTESAFCKYVCPLGTFNFVYSTASPTQITTRSLEICKSCAGKECVNGSYAPEPSIRIDSIPVLDGSTQEVEVRHGPQGTPGCGTELFVPQIKSNLDCVLCLDCVRACPHDNVALIARLPGRELFNMDAWPKRWDISLMVIALAFMGIVNAFGMIPPVYGLLQDIANTLGLSSATMSSDLIAGLTLFIVFAVGGLILPVVLALLAGTLTRALTNTFKKYSLRDTVAAFAPAFVPLSFGIWIGHYGFHFLIGAFSIVPVFQNFLIDHNITLLGSEPNWMLSGIQDVGAIGIMQVIALLGGFLLSMVIAQGRAQRLYRRDAPMALLPWALLLLGLMIVTIAIFGEPMEMRGTILFD